MRLFAFQGTHYRKPAEEAGRLAAPPFDQIGDRLRDELQARSPFHFSHLSRPIAGGEEDPYRHAAVLHRRWLEEGVLERDAQPALYPYLVELADGRRRLGLCGLVGLEPPEAGVIRPHEETLEKPLADRLALLRAMRVDLEPILLLADDEGVLEGMLARDVPGLSEAAGPHEDPEGNRHLLYRLDDPDRIARYQQTMTHLPAAIADGHHRYKVASLYAQEIGAQPETAAAAKLAVITSLASPALIIDPVHRALEQRIEPEALTDVIVERLPWSGDGGRAFAMAVAEASAPALGVWVAGQTPEIWRLDPEASGSRRSAAANRLAVTLLHDGLLARLGIDEAAVLGGAVLFRSDPGALWRMVHEGKAGTGFFLPPMSPEEFGAAIAEGDLLPPKSTRFLPKLVSGLVWAEHDSRLG